VRSAVTRAVISPFGSCLRTAAEDEVCDGLATDADPPALVSEQHENRPGLVDGELSVAAAGIADRIERADRRALEAFEQLGHQLTVQGVEVELDRCDALAG
jgi:hypothetical protein